MVKYNKEFTKLDNLELIQVSGDRTEAAATAWAKKETLPWPTVLMSDISKTFIKDIKTQYVPTYILIDKEGKEIQRGIPANLMKKFEELTKK